MVAHPDRHVGEPVDCSAILTEGQQPIGSSLSRLAGARFTEMSRIFFPLRTSVELFGDPTSVDAVARAKEASILYDEVVFELGLYDIQITGQGSIADWRPPGGFTADDIARSRQLPEPGSGVRVEVSVNPDLDEPTSAEPIRLGYESELVVSYVAEWHSGIVEELQKLNPSWAGTTVWSESDPKMEPMKTQHEAVQVALRDAYPLVRDFLIRALAHDAVVAASLGSAMSVTSVFATLVGGLDARPDPAGDTALSVLVPNVSRLNWEQIAEFREHSGAIEAREKLREFERRVMASEPSDPLEFRTRLFQEISTDFFAALDELAPNFGVDISEEAAKFGVSFIPIVGPFLGPGASLLEAVLDAQQQRHAWYAALMRLRNATTQ
jgi:hypothetical protein